MRDGWAATDDRWSADPLLGQASEADLRPIALPLQIPGFGALGVRACRLVTQAVPNPGRAIGSRPLIGHRIKPEASPGFLLGAARL